MLFSNHSDALSMPKWYARHCVIQGESVEDNKLILRHANTRFKDGDCVIYFSQNPIGGLENESVYFLKTTDGDTFEVCLERGGEALTITPSTGSQLFVKYDTKETTEDGTIEPALLAVDIELAQERIYPFVSPGWYHYHRYTSSDGNQRIKAELLVSLRSMVLEDEPPVETQAVVGKAVVGESTVA